MYRQANFCWWGLLLFPLQAAADTFYREKFGYCEISTSLPAAFKVAGWRGLTAGKVEGKPSTLRIQTVGAGSVLPAVQSDPEGPADGNAFWARPAGNLLVFTQERSFDVAKLVSVSWQQRIDREERRLASYGARLALLIDGLWYISDYSATQLIRGQYETVELVPSALTYGVTAGTTDVGPPPPMKSGIQLPESGTVAAFGLFFQSVYSKVRIDDFTLTDRSPAGAYPPDETYESCSAKDEPPPTDICENDGSSTLRLRISSKKREKLLNVAGGRSLRRYRDRVLISLAASPLTLGEIAALTPARFVKSGKRYTLTLADGRSLRLSPPASRDLAQYLRRATSSPLSNVPLFRRFDPRGVLTDRSLCASDLLKIVKSYARIAGLMLSR